MSEKRDITGKWGYSVDNEVFEDTLDTPEQAIVEGNERALDAGVMKFYIGQYEGSPDPAGYIDADLIIEHVKCQDDFSHEFAEDWPDESREQNDELTEIMRATFRQWLDRHGLNPTFSTVDPSSIRELHATETEDEPAEDQGGVVSQQSENDGVCGDGESGNH